MTYVKISAGQVMSANNVNAAPRAVVHRRVRLHLVGWSVATSSACFRHAHDVRSGALPGRGATEADKLRGELSTEGLRKLLDERCLREDEQARCLELHHFFDVDRVSFGIIVWVLGGNDIRDVLGMVSRIHLMLTATGVGCGKLIHDALYGKAEES